MSIAWTPSCAWIACSTTVSSDIDTRMSEEAIRCTLQRLLSTLGHRDCEFGLRPVSGGDTARAYRVELADGRRYFCKYRAQRSHRGEPSPFATESQALQRIAATHTFVVPEPLALTDDLLLLSWLDLQAGDHDWEERFGRTLAQMHLATRHDRFGLPVDNWLGGSVQENGWSRDWSEFWQERRLAPQLTRLKGILPGDDVLLRALSGVQTRVPELLQGLQPMPVLLHGDLWSGNVAADVRGRPVVLDPAAYYGHHEAEFGMLRLFGGFSSRCEAAYREILPFAEGFEDRVTLYRLYHEVNHLLLFGRAYYAMSLSSARRLG